jgi:hypothetical protein
MLLLPPNVEYRIQPTPESKNLRYTLQCQSSSTCMSLNDDGVLSVSGEKGKGAVLVEDPRIDS